MTKINEDEVREKSSNHERMIRKRRWKEEKVRERNQETKLERSKKKCYI